MNKKFYIETFGCQMNKADSDIIINSMEKHGFVRTRKIENTNILIYNTCSVRQHAEDRVKARIKTERPRVISKDRTTIVTGCMAQRLGLSLIKNKFADIVVGPYESPSMGLILERYFLDKSNKIFLSQDEEKFQSRVNYEFSEDTKVPWHQWVTITHGCENFCAYCIVPYVRGKLISFQSHDIIKYVELSVKKGAKEITLLGQNVNQYGLDNGDISFYKLLEKCAKIKGIERLNFLTSHPMDFKKEILEVIADNPNISRSIHLPLQSGSDNILKAMGRKYNSEFYFNIINDIDSILDDYSITTDLIVGFPGETEKDYNKTIEAVKEIRFDEAFMYAYSPRVGTPAYNLKEILSKKEKSERLSDLITIQRKISKEKLIQRIDKIEKMIVERVSKKSDKMVLGKTFLNHPVIIPGDHSDIGIVKNVLIKEIKGATLNGIEIV